MFAPHYQWQWSVSLERDVLCREGGEKRTMVSRAGRRAGVQCCHPAPGEPHVLGGQTAAVTTSLAE